MLPALVVMGASQPFGLAILALVVAARWQGPPGREILWAIPASVLGTAGIVGFYRGMAAGAITVVAPIASVAAAIPVAWGLAHGDGVSFVQELGFVAALGGTAMTSIERGGDRARIAAGTGWAFVALLGFGGYFVLFHDASPARLAVAVVRVPPDIRVAHLARRSSSGGRAWAGSARISQRSSPSASSTRAATSSSPPPRRRTGS